LRWGSMRNYFAECLLLLGGAGFYGMLIVGAVRYFFKINDDYVMAMYLAICLIIFIFAYRYHSIGLRNAWNGHLKEKKHTSLTSSFISLLFGSTVFTAIFAPFASESNFLLDVNYYLICGLMFILSFSFMFYLMFCKKPPRRSGWR